MIDAGVEAMLADVKPGRNFGDAVGAFSYLLNLFNLEFFWEPCLLLCKDSSTSRN